MKNPWTKISLSDYESHMSLDSVYQLQALNERMKVQLNTYPVSSVMILGIAGGNGLEHIQKDRYEKIIGVDINPEYLRETKRRFTNLNGVLQCFCTDLCEDPEKLPSVDFVIANLLIEYIGLEAFQTVLYHVKPEYVSCIIQNNLDECWVSDSPYLHVFDCLDQVHHAMSPSILLEAMRQITYHPIAQYERILPNKKSLIQIDFQKS